MSTLFVNFNDDQTIRSGAIRYEGQKLPNVTIEDLWRTYNLLISFGKKPIVTPHPEGGTTHMIVYGD